MNLYCILTQSRSHWAHAHTLTTPLPLLSLSTQAFMHLCGTPSLSSPEMLIVEYFCDKEKAELYAHETKELQVGQPVNWSANTGQFNGDGFVLIIITPHMAYYIVPMQMKIAQQSIALQLRDCSFT